MFDNVRVDYLDTEDSTELHQLYREDRGEIADIPSSNAEGYAVGGDEFAVLVNGGGILAIYYKDDGQWLEVPTYDDEAFECHMDTDALGAMILNHVPGGVDADDQLAARWRALTEML